MIIACLRKVLSLPQLSERGVKHLDADVKYLSNVFHALDLPAPPILEHLSLLAALDRDHAAAHLAQETVAGEKKKRVAHFAAGFVGETNWKAFHLYVLHGRSSSF